MSTGEDQQPGLSQVVVEAPSIQHPTRGNSPGAEGSEISSLSKDSITVTVVDMSSSQERQPLRSGTNYTHWVHLDTLILREDITLIKAYVISFVLQNIQDIIL